MNLATRFFSGPNVVIKLLSLGEPKGVTRKVPVTRYTYETHNAIYDVDVRQSDGEKSYQTNCAWAGEGVIHPIHVQIERHFEI